MPSVSSPKPNVRPVYRMKRFWSLVFLVGLFALLNSCAATRVMMQTASAIPNTRQMTPPLVLPDVIQKWEDQTLPIIKTSLQTEIYGRYPEELILSLVSQNTKPGVFFDGKGTITTLKLRIANPFSNISRDFDLAIIQPVNIQNPPVIIMQKFCPVNDVIPEAGLSPPDGISFSCGGDGIMTNVFDYFFGRYIRTPPIDMILEYGFAIAVMHPPEFIPDNRQQGLYALSEFFPNEPTSSAPRAIGAWAKQFSLVANLLEDKFAFSKSILNGHSRYGKTALVAAAFDPLIDGVVSHQSGTGGASLSIDKPGETVAAITQGYPHWFSPNYNTKHLTVDQHVLLAAIAPRPVLLGNAKRDVWSDPEGAFLAARAATPTYALYGSQGLTAAKLTDFKPDDNLAFWIRPGTHGVVKEDWPAFLEFLITHFK